MEEIGAGQFIRLHIQVASNNEGKICPENEIADLLHRLGMVCFLSRPGIDGNLQEVEVLRFDN